jgi:hypothetical protein
MQRPTEKEQTFMDLIHERKDTGELWSELSAKLKMKPRKIEEMFDDLELRGLIRSEMRMEKTAGNEMGIGYAIWMKNEN